MRSQSAHNHAFVSWSLWMQPCTRAVSVIHTCQICVSTGHVWGPTLYLQDMVHPKTLPNLQANTLIFAVGTPNATLPGAATTILVGVNNTDNLPSILYLDGAPFRHCYTCLSVVLEHAGNL